MATAAQDGAAVWAPNGDQLFRIAGQATCVQFLREDPRVLLAGFADGNLTLRNLDGTVDGIVSPFSAPVVGFTELASHSLVVASSEGHLSLVILKSVNDVRYEVYSLGKVQPLTCCKGNPLDTEYTFLCGTKDGQVHTQTRRVDASGATSGSNTEFVLMDSFDILKEPHRGKGENDQKLSNKLYSSLSVNNVDAAFSTTNSQELVCVVNTLRYAFVRNYISKTVTKRIPLTVFPLSVSFGGIWIGVGSNNGIANLINTQDSSIQPIYTHKNNTTKVFFQNNTNLAYVGSANHLFIHSIM